MGCYRRIGRRNGVEIFAEVSGLGAFWALALAWARAWMRMWMHGRRCMGVSAGMGAFVDMIVRTGGMWLRVWTRSCVIVQMRSWLLGSS
jgi:hypothetical protein